MQVKHLDDGNNSELVRTPQKYWMESPPVHGPFISVFLPARICAVPGTGKYFISEQNLHINDSEHLNRINQKSERLGNQVG